MPSTLIGPTSGATAVPLWSGFPFSGTPFPVGAVNLRLDKSASGNAYIYCSGAGIPVASGGPTITSGGPAQSGAGLLDGMILYPGDTYIVPRNRIATSGGVGTIAISCDPAASGQARLWWDLDTRYYGG